MLIGIDPGHGGKDPGATNNVLNLQEKQVTLAISLWLKDFLQYNNLETLLTREEDVYLTLQERATMLNKAAVDYIISVHINSSTSSEPNYLSSHIIAKGGQAEQLAGKLQNALVKEMAWPDGGV